MLLGGIARSTALRLTVCSRSISRRRRIDDESTDPVACSWCLPVRKVGVSGYDDWGCVTSAFRAGEVRSGERGCGHVRWWDSFSYVMEAPPGILAMPIGDLRVPKPRWRIPPAGFFCCRYFGGKPCALNTSARAITSL